MQKQRKIALAGATVAVALGSGYLMQSSPAADVSRAAEPKAITELSAPPEKPVVAAVVTSPAPAPVPAAPEPAPERLETVAVTDTVTEAPPPVAAPAPAPVAAEPACPVTFLATPADGAVIDVTLLAPCAPQTRVVLRHGGLAITGRTSDTGALFVTLPAMEPEGRVSLRLDDGETHEAATPVDLSSVRRFAVQWVEADAFQLHAYENGAAFGTTGHVSAARPQPAAGIDTPKGGSLMQLGDAGVTLPMLAEVYSYPADTAVPVEVTVEATVTEATCNREILGEVLESAAGRVSTAEITLAMPACDAIGEFLVLNNLQPGTTLAAAK